MHNWWRVSVMKVEGLPVIDVERAKRSRSRSGPMICSQATRNPAYRSAAEYQEPLSSRSDHSGAIKDHIIVLIFDPVMLTSWRQYEDRPSVLSIAKEKSCQPVGIASTGHGARRTTCSVVLPRRASSNPSRPAVGIAIMSAWRSRAMRKIVSSTGP